LSSPDVSEGIGVTNTSLEPSAVHAVEIPDSRGGPTLAVTVTPPMGRCPGWPHAAQ